MIDETTRQQAQRHRRAREKSARRVEAAHAREQAKRSDRPGRGRKCHQAAQEPRRAAIVSVASLADVGDHSVRGQRPDDDDRYRRRPRLEPVYPRGSVHGPTYDGKGRWIRPTLPSPIGYLDPDTGRLVRTEALTA
jgi:hypothetical protein